MSATPHSLVSYLFLTFDDGGQLDWQGEVTEDLGAGHYLCQLFSALSAAPTCQIVKHLSDMATWRLYNCEDMWKRDYADLAAAHRP